MDSSFQLNYVAKHAETNQIWHGNGMEKIHQTDISLYEIYLIILYQ